jgi:hypothetical protein
MATVTFNLPDALAADAAEAGIFTPDWFAGITRAALDRLAPARTFRQESAAPVDSISRMRGCDKYTGDTMEAYFQRKKADKEYELALEARRAGERRRYAELSS